MPSEYVKRLRRGYEAWNRTGDLSLILSEVDPAIEIKLPEDAPEAGAVFKGHQGTRQALETLAEAWSEIRFEPLEFLDGGDKVVVIFRQRSRGRHTGLEMEAIGAHLWLAGKSGKALRLEVFNDPEQAREKLSLSPGPSGTG